MIRELWPSHGELPYEEGPLPPHYVRTVNGDPKVIKRYRFAKEMKLVVYDRAHPEVRLAFFLDSPFYRDGEGWQSILETRVERDRGVDPKQSRELEQRLWDEICTVERRGRPVGTGHPKRRQSPEFFLSSADVDSLRKAGLDETDLRIFFARCDGDTFRTFEKIGKELGMSQQAAWKRWTRRILPALNKINPRFSERSLKLAIRDSK